MCGIWAYVSNSSDTPSLAGFDAIKHRGPDNDRTCVTMTGAMGFARLRVNDASEDGDQPFKYGNAVVACNGEIYNHAEIGYATSSDCSVLAPAFVKHGFRATCARLDAEFAVIAKIGNTWHVARDPIGIRPLFYGRTDRAWVFASEAKGVVGYVDRVEPVPPGCAWDSETQTFEPYATPVVSPVCARIAPDPAVLRDTLIAAVRKRTMSDAPIGFFLSGGLDSSIVAAIGASLSDEPITTFSIGAADSPDVKYARVMAKHLGSDHHEVALDPDAAFDAIERVVRATETYDTTTVRASVPMFLLSEYVKTRTDVRVLLSGEGADELFGGYLYFHGAPSPDAFHDECVRLVRDVHEFDVRRADRCTAAHGLEVRVPFFDLAFAAYATSIDPAHKTCRPDRMEKHLLRLAFDGMLPPEIAWRQKNGMSDAVGASWVDLVRDRAGEGGEEAMYRAMFDAIYGDALGIPYYWRPRWTSERDPSARKLPQFKL